jgi:hypothetical protein
MSIKYRYTGKNYNQGKESNMNIVYVDMFCLFGLVVYSYCLWQIVVQINKPVEYKRRGE